VSAGWVCPVVSWHGYQPKVSDGYSAVKTAAHREHHGVDVMFRRNGDPLEAAYPPGTPNGSKHYMMPNGVVVVAAQDGLVWSCKSSPGGLSIVLDHGKLWAGATYYQHMSKVFVPFTTSGRGGVRVKRGQAIGIVGGSPLDGEKLMHLHFEMWQNGANGVAGGADAHVDPESHGFSSWPVLSSAVTNASRLLLVAGLLLMGGVVLPRLLQVA